MVTKSKPPEPSIAHRRTVYPAASKGQWRIGCSCGWIGRFPANGPTKPTKELDAMFVAHVPAESLRTYVLVDQTPVPDPSDPESGRTLPAGNFLMPEGVPCVFDKHWEDDGVRWVHLVEPIEGNMPVGEVRTSQGKVFRLD